MQASQIQAIVDELYAFKVQFKLVKVKRIAPGDLMYRESFDIGNRLYFVVCVTRQKRLLAYSNHDTKLTMQRLSISDNRYSKDEGEFVTFLWHSDKCISKYMFQLVEGL